MMTENNMTIDAINEANNAPVSQAIEALVEANEFYDTMSVEDKDAFDKMATELYNEIPEIEAEFQLLSDFYSDLSNDGYYLRQLADELYAQGR